MINSPHTRNYRPPLNLQAEKQASSPKTWVILAVIVMGYAAAQYATEQGDAKALREENARLQEKIRQHTECKSSFYRYPNIPPAVIPRSGRKEG